MKPRSFRSLRFRGATVLTAIVALALPLSACGKGESVHAENGVTTLRYLGWTDQVTVPELAESLGYFDGKVKLAWSGTTISGPQEIQSAATGQVDFGGAFAGAVAKLITAGAPITAVINYYGSDEKSFQGYYVPNDSPVHTAADLVGKKIGVNTLGGQNEADIHDALAKAGLSLDQIRSVQLVPLPPPNIEDAVRKGQVDAAALSGQFQQRALAIGGLRPVFTELDEYGGPIDGGPYVFRNDVIAKNADAVRIFTTGVARALEWERNTPRDQVVAKMSDIITARHRSGEDTSTLKYWQSVGVPARFGVISDQDFARWESWLRDTGAIHGPLDPTKFYTNKFNGLAQPS
ncbi:ABC transporter substrate-binding protein [Nocardia sp. BMG111209]|uniref:ABC transporter substrate-binding protein n=1 Tax=Nocardia sp. BMG111209 TaxID=1160137 RepID=UPI000377D54F|nr:ABC transporter substrate-binding protein [Nocardia sp. BMG111209]